MLDSDGEEGQERAWPFELKCSPFVGLPPAPAGANAASSSHDVSTGGMRMLDFDVGQPAPGALLQCVPRRLRPGPASDPAAGRRPGDTGRRMVTFFRLWLPS
jgi:hypothetical protein